MHCVRLPSRMDQSGVLPPSDCSYAVFRPHAPRCPPSTSGNQQKYILRKLAERLGVPREVLYRPKQGFSLPLVHWMRNELKDVLMVLLEPRTLQRGYFEAAGIRKLMDDHLVRGR